MQLANINQSLDEINSRTVEQIDIDYQLKINEVSEEARTRIKRTHLIQEIMPSKK